MASDSWPYLSSHQRRLYLFTTTLLPIATDAEDVLQEANMVLWEKLDQYRPGTVFRLGMPHHPISCIEVSRAACSRGQLLDPNVLDRLASVAAEQLEYLDEFRRRALIDCADQLSPCDRELIRQRYVEAQPVGDCRNRKSLA